MWQEIEKVVPDPSVLRRLLFAAVNVPKSTPGYAKIILDFAFGTLKRPNPVNTLLLMLMENLEFLSKHAFDTDKELLAELCVHDGFREHPLGVVLVPRNDTCKSCQAELKLRGDRPSFLTLYTDDMGTIPATLFRKFCSNSHKGCTFTQHYGFHTFNDKDNSEMVADCD